MTNTKRVPTCSVHTPYGDLLRGLSAVGDHDVDTLGLLGAMVECVGEGRYGTLKVLFRLLPLRDRHALGPPPESRTEDAVGVAGAGNGWPAGPRQDAGSPVAMR